VTIPKRSIAHGEVPAAHDLASLLLAEEPSQARELGRNGYLFRESKWPSPAWVVDYLLGNPVPWQITDWIRTGEVLGSPPGESRSSEFARHIAYDPVVPFESSPLGPTSLWDLGTAGTDVGATIGEYVTGHPLLLLSLGAGMVVCGAARGIGEALRIGLRARILELMGVEDPERTPGSPDD
jgi:hypothetical protein